MPLMTWDEYKDTEHDIPYVFILDMGFNSLYYFGERHSFDPEDVQWTLVKKVWNVFLQATDNKKRIVFIEGGKRPIEADETQSILKHGGMGLATYLAHQAGIETFSPEPDEAWERSQLEKEFSREQIQYYYFASIVHQWGCKLDPKPPFEKYASSFLKSDEKVSGWTNIDFSLDSMKKIHASIFNTTFDENNTDFFYNAVNPVELQTVINRISRASSAIRDAYIVSKIEEYSKNGYSIFAQYGCSHVVMQEPLLREVLSEPQHIQAISK